MFLTSKLLDVPHGFTTRQGGVSRGAWATLNLSRTVGDDPGAVDENARRLAAAARLAGPVVTARQVHGTRVLAAAPPSGPDPLPAPTEEADALVASEPGYAVGVKTADCVPILIQAGPAVAAVHAGWRGTYARVAGTAVGALIAAGCPSAAMRIVLGPAIGPCCFDVGDDVAQKFARDLSPDVVERRNGRPFVDLWAANRIVLEAAGVPAAAIDELRRCTRCEAERFFSHRRDRGVTGRHLAFIAMP